MRLSYLMILVAVPACLLAIGWIVDPRTWLRDTEVGIDDLPGNVRVIGQQRAVTERIARELEHVKTRIVAEEQVVSDLIAGNLTLREAIRRIRESRTKGELELLISLLRELHGGQSEDDVLCRHLVAATEDMLAYRRWHLLQGRCVTDAELKQHDLEARAVMIRLEKESTAFKGSP